MAALLLQFHRGLVLSADLDEVLVVPVVFTEVGAEAALAVLNLQHGGSPFGLCRDDAAAVAGCAERRQVTAIVRHILVKKRVKRRLTYVLIQGLIIN